MSTKNNQIGINYNQPLQADPYLTEQLIKHLNPKKEGLYLDIGCGTGNYTNALYDKGFQCVGMDPSIEMLKQALSKNRNISWKMGLAERTYLPQNSVDGVFSTLTIHQWSNLMQAFSELAYVLKPQGKIVIFTSTPEQMKGYWLNHYFPKMMEDLIAQMPTLERVEKAISYSGFKIIKTKSYTIQPDLEDHFLYCGKHNPEVYFDDSIRHGISSFSNLTNMEEIELGLATLKNDIDDKKINDVMKSYENNLGDYLFIIAENSGENPL
ncbi:class I SAM-dependent methyltransferase [Winogradskyella helgolandensis]|uniref:class I SAM-dependent methyltransferase n=1 Tax=Winogradskyella helgolandensis TaxID=2697010 RepID=UPI0015CD2F51|nr:class I SAM-dependent methyltransferase [Winogradskyella helgolandensis]